MKGKRFFTKKTLKRVLATILVLLTVNFILMAWAETKLAKAVREAGADSLRLQDTPQRMLPKRENVSTYLEAASGVADWPTEFDAVQDLGGTLYKQSHRPTKEELDLMHSIVERNHLVYALIREATACRSVWFETNYGTAQPTDYSIPNILGRRRIAHILRAGALLSIYEGRTKDAYEYCLQGLRLPIWYTEESPNLIICLIAMSAGKMSVDTLQALLTVSPPDRDTRRSIMEALNALREKDLVTQSLVHERAVRFNEFQHSLISDRRYFRTILQLEKPAILGASTFPSIKALMGHPARFISRGVLVKINQAADLNVWNKILESASLSCFESGEKLNRENLVGDVPFYVIVDLADSVHIAERVLLERDELNVMLDLAQTATALADYREMNGSYPPGLDALAPDFIAEVPEDQLSGKPYVYQRYDDDYALYSVSANGMDDGGTTTYGDGWKVYGDIVWKPPRPKSTDTP